MVDMKKIIARRDQIAAIPKNDERQKALVGRVLAHIDTVCATSGHDLEALWADIGDAMTSRLGDCSWSAAVPEHLPPPVVAPDPAPKVEVSKRTGKPKRKYTRRKKA